MERTQVKAGFLFNNSIVFLNVREFRLFSNQIPAGYQQFTITF